MKLNINHLSAFEGISPEGMTRQITSISKINDYTEQQKNQVAAAIWTHNERHREFWAAGNDAELEAMLNAVGIGELQSIFEKNMKAANNLNALALLVEIEQVALVEPLRSITIDDAGKISVNPLPTPENQPQE